MRTEMRSSVAMQQAWYKKYSLNSSKIAMEYRWGKQTNSQFKHCIDKRPYSCNNSVTILTILSGHSKNSITLCWLNPFFTKKVKRNHNNIEKSVLSTGKKFLPELTKKRPADRMSDKNTAHKGVALLRTKKWNAWIDRKLFRQKKFLA